MKLHCERLYLCSRLSFLLFLTFDVRSAVIA